MDSRISLREIVAPQVALLHAEVWTGVILTLDGRRFIGTGSVFRIFGTLDEARAYAHAKVSEDGEVECAIVAPTGEQLDVIRPAWVEEK